jgi:hypothetical protein
MPAASNQKPCLFNQTGLFCGWGFWGNGLDWNGSGEDPLFVVALMFLALANARSVSPSASYLKIGMPHHHQVTKCPCSWLGPTSSGTFTPATLRGPAAIRHPWRGRLSRHPCRSAHGAPPAFSLHPSRVLCRLGYRTRRSKIKIKINSEHGCPSRPNSCGRRRRSRRQRGGGSVMKLSTDLPPSSDRGPGCRTAAPTGICGVA